MSTTNRELIEKIRKFFEEEAVKENDPTKIFSEDVVNLAYQKMSQSMLDLVQQEEDPMVLAELLKNFLDTKKLVDEQGLPRQQMLLKLFEQLTKYEQSKYY